MGKDFIAYCIGNTLDMRLATATADRAWIRQTTDGFARRCLPMLIANQAGWMVLNGRALRAKWLGGNGLDSIVLEEKGDTPQPAFSHFGNGILTFALPFLFRTPPGTALLFRGPANAPKDAIAPLEGLVETDWSVATATMNWKFTRPNTWVEFAAGEPICMVVPQLFELLEEMQPRLADIGEDQATREDYRAWSDSRAQFVDGIRKGDPHTVKTGWQRHYFRGTAPKLSGPGAGTERKHRTRLKLQEFAKRDLISETQGQDGT